MVTKKKTSAPQMKCVWSLVCHMSSVDQQTNQISLFGVIEEVRFQKALLDASKNPENIIPLQHEVVLHFRRLLNLDISDEEIDSEIKLQLLDPEGKNLYEVVSPMKIPKSKMALRFKIGVMGFKYTTPGTYMYRVEMKHIKQENFDFIREMPIEVISI